MHDRTVVLLGDMARFGEFIAQYTDSLTFDDYRRPSLVRAAVERNVITLGIAARRLKQADPGIFSRLPTPDRFIDLGKHLTYSLRDEIDDPVVWEAARTSIPRFMDDVRALLNQEGHS